MVVDRYTKAVLSVIAACLVWLSVGGPSLLVLVHLRIFDRKTLAVGQTTNRPQRANALFQGVSRYPPVRLKRVYDR